AKHIIADYYVYEKLKHIKHVEFRFLKYIGLASMSVSKNIFMIYNWEDISVIKITNSHIAKSFRDFFYNLWRIAKPMGKSK
ncbi:MAG: hypothetical protein KAT35_00975, partial [Candidatus Aenigmarchaeota archaeon]|nr:hypothetical protein [Candidatus Aenigmarchaeota archaeon]